MLGVVVAAGAVCLLACVGTCAGLRARDHAWVEARAAELSSCPVSDVHVAGHQGGLLDDTYFLEVCGRDAVFVCFAGDPEGCALHDRPPASARPNGR